MKLPRRDFLVIAGSALFLAHLPAIGGRRVVTVDMRGTARGERVWFDPFGLALETGVAVTFVNRDPGNSHTVTAYHPRLFERVRRIPAQAEPFDSGYLLPGESFELTLTVPGVYDFYCIPHEQAGMVGRLVVGRPGDPGWDGSATTMGGDHR
ncbi:plastocyanin/azurin family copper-binding protein [Marinobacter sp. X15-166B]|uniref:plastocyanin/azurin family copper-binding protein n=1 Tax=Marinobacter sp. X15-166B TaxID=1897620 RepID=UPI0009F206A1|nr:plastocyanin/azurin family copper-binding protein [Marinobacter sp. X15-166B]